MNRDALSLCTALGGLTSPHYEDDGGGNLHPGNDDGAVGGTPLRAFGNVLPVYGRGASRTFMNLWNALTMHRLYLL